MFLPGSGATRGLPVSRRRRGALIVRADGEGTKPPSGAAATAPQLPAGRASSALGAEACRCVRRSRADRAHVLAGARASLAEATSLEGTYFVPAASEAGEGPRALIFFYRNRGGVCGPASSLVPGEAKTFYQRPPAGRDVPWYDYVRLQWPSRAEVRGLRLSHRHSPPDQ